MSPKSRGRVIKTSRRGPTPAHSSPLRALLATGRHLPTGTSLDAEQWASLALSSAWIRAADLNPDPEGRLVELVIDEVTRRPTRPGWAALAALQLMTEHQQLDQVLVGQQLPYWAGSPVPHPLTAWVAKDVYDEQSLIVLEYEDHLLLTAILHVGGLMITSIGVAPREASGDIEKVLTTVSLTSRSPVSVTEACTKLAAASRAFDTWRPRVDDPDVVPGRLLLRRRALPYDVGTLDTEPDPAGQQRRRERFLVGRDPELGFLVGVFLDFGQTQLTEPLRWGPDAVTCFLLDYLPRTVTLDAHDHARLLDLLREWVMFIHAESGLDAAATGAVLEAISRVEPQFRSSRKTLSADRSRT